MVEMTTRPLLWYTYTTQTMYQLPLRKKILLEKRIGETPLQTIDRFKASRPRYKDIRATYAGRLDPMASGKLLVLFGDECKKKDQYLGLDKQYDIEILLGAGSDTGDVLGIVESAAEVSVHKKQVEELFSKEVGTFERAYPAYSSKTVAGKPLFLYALEGTLDTIDIPTHKETMYRIALKKIEHVDSSTLRQRITTLLSLTPTSTEESKVLGADFRIADVKNSWEQVLVHKRSYTVLSINVSCGSGAYMRTLAGRIGESLGTSALALSIHRSAIG